MSQSNHTPGPWAASKDTAFVRTDNEDQYAIACVYGAYGNSGMDEVAGANSCLIAAAPDLLEELRLAHEIIRNALTLMTTEQQVAWSQLNEKAGLITDGATRAHERSAVIAKASGAV